MGEYDTLIVIEGRFLITGKTALSARRNRLSSFFEAHRTDTYELEALQKLTSDRTTITIAHRFSTLRNATRIVVLNRKGVAEVGTHEELLRQKGIYYGLVMAQRQMSKMRKSNQSVPA